MHKTLRHAAGAILLAVFCAGAHADDAAALRQRLEGMQALAADFTSTVVRKDGGKSVSQGMMALKRPDRLIMHTQSPDEQILYTCGKDLCYFDPFVNQLSIYSRSQGSNSPFMLLTDSSKELWSRYEIKAENGVYSVKPLKSRDIAVMKLSFKGDLVDALVLEMKDGSVNTYALSNVSSSVSDQVFDVAIPEDAEVDDERGAD